MKASVEIESKFEVDSVVQTLIDRYYVPKNLETKHNSKMAKILQIEFNERCREFYYLCEWDNNERLWLAECNLKGASEGVHVNLGGATWNLQKH